MRERKRFSRLNDILTTGSAGGFSFILTYGLPLSATFVRPGLNSCVLHSTCRWLQLPPVGDYSPLLYRQYIHPASVRQTSQEPTLTFFFSLIFSGGLIIESNTEIGMLCLCSLFWASTFVRSRPRLSDTSFPVQS